MSIEAHTHIHTDHTTHFKPSSLGHQCYFGNERLVTELQVRLINTLNGTLYDAPCMQPAVNNWPKVAMLCVCVCVCVCV